MQVQKNYVLLFTNTRKSRIYLFMLEEYKIDTTQKQHKGLERSLGGGNDMFDNHANDIILLLR